MGDNNHEVMQVTFDSKYFYRQHCKGILQENNISGTFIWIIMKTDTSESKISSNLKLPGQAAGELS